MAGMRKGARRPDLERKAAEFRSMILPPSLRCKVFGAKSSVPRSIFRAKEADMESIISSLVARFERGSLSRRDLVRSLAILAAGGTAASAQEELNFKAATIDHVSIQVADLQRSVDFYQKMFGFSVVSQEQARSIMRLGNTRTLVSLNRESPAGIVDHFAIGIPRFNRDSAMRYLKERGATPLQGNFAGLHVKDPDGIRVQISANGGA